MSAAVEWSEQAACAGMDQAIFFPPRGGRARDCYEEARKVCRACPVRFPCLEEAMRTELSGNRFGMAGGLTPKERDNVRRFYRKSRAS